MKGARDFLGLHERTVDDDAVLPPCPPGDCRAGLLYGVSVPVCAGPDEVVADPNDVRTLLVLLVVGWAFEFVINPTRFYRPRRFL